MERSTFIVLFYIKRTKKLKDGTSPIFARITVNGQRTEFGMQLSIAETLWNKDKGRANGSSKDSRIINSEIESAYLKLHEKRAEIERSGIEVTAQGIKNEYFGINESRRTLLEVFSEHNDRCKSLVDIDFAQGTYERYVACYGHVKRFMSFMYHKNDIPLVEITPVFIRDFEFYLKTERKCAHNTTTKYIKNFQKIIRIALANGWMKVNPFSNIKFHLDEVDMDFLTEQELNVLLNKELTIERLQQVKDVYLFCCFTGLAFVDVKSLVYTDIEKKDGKLWIKKRRQKTKNWCNIPMLEPAVHIMNKYRSHPLCQKNGTVLPVLTNQKMNAYLKEIADVCGINKNLSTHTARHTFATTVTLANQISIEVVSKMLGHSSINMTKKYARVVDDLINRDMTKIYGKYEKVKIA
ncbi:MAG: site-specific integrase [Bacteroidetes bacterium]|nr:site-specific integrase [Bacteroidota bacterium]